MDTKIADYQDKRGSRLRRIMPVLPVVSLAFALLSISLACSANAATIIACFNNTNGDLREVSAADQCRHSESPISWNQTGPQGPTGPAGPTGAVGPAGPSGPPGPAGSANAWSLTGNSGTTAGTNFLGTTDSQPVEIHSNAARVLRLEPANPGNCRTAINENCSPNVIGGAANNAVNSGVQGATLGGGGGFSGGADRHNRVTADWGTIGGGIENTASGQATVAGGFNNTASGTLATIPGGQGNIAGGVASFAAGNGANAVHDGTFVWADLNEFPFSSTAVNEFWARATGGFNFVTAIDNTGVTSKNCTIDTSANLVCSGTITGSSDRNAKEHFSLINDREILERLDRIPIQSWNFKSESRVRHIGPMAQDFYAAFDVGADDKHISMVDADGVALAATQGLYRIVKEKEAEIARQQAEISALRAEQLKTSAQLKEKDARERKLEVRLDALEQEAGIQKTHAW